MSRNLTAVAVFFSTIWRDWGGETGSNFFAHSGNEEFAILLPVVHYFRVRKFLLFLTLKKGSFVEEGDHDRLGYTAG
jgi:hypothetical protein